MNVSMDPSLIAGYSSPAQISRILTESWISTNMYCPRCGNDYIVHCKNNSPVEDFACPVCGCEYELKSTKGKIGHKIPDGSYRTMLERINSNNNPDFMFMSYSREEMHVNSLMLIPRHFFHPDLIEKRAPLSASARRSGWIGCNILIENIPKQGIIPIVADKTVVEKNQVLRALRYAEKLYIKSIESRGWMMDVLNCVNSIPHDIFTLKEVYTYEKKLHNLHPGNNNIRPKIRQQLQVLRNLGIITFEGNGVYKKTSQ